jgi:hypothetical protein
LTYRLFRKSLIHQQRDVLRHAPGTATLAEIPPLVSERQQELDMTGVAP